MISLYESILQSTKSGKSYVMLTVKELLDRGYKRVAGAVIDGYYPANKKGVMLNCEGISYDTRNKTFFFQFNLYKKSRRAILKTISDLDVIEDYWKLKNTVGKSAEAYKKLKEIKDTFDIITL